MVARRIRAQIASFAFVACSTLTAALGSAQAPAPAPGAAAQFDRGVAAYKAGDFAAAADAFLTADGLAPSVTALSNALAAARRSGDALRMARAAERTLSRGESSPTDRQSAQIMLEEATKRLARFDVTCADAADCAPSCDGVSIARGIHYAAPGTHRFGDASGAQREVTCGEGQLCSVVLNGPVTAPVVLPARAAPEVAAPSEPGPALRASAVDRGPSEPAWRRRLPIGLLVASSAGALAFAGLATWQGVEALHAKSDFKAGRREDWGDVKGFAHRSDAFTASAIVLAGVAAATAIWWVDWDARSRTSLSFSPRGGATLTTLRRF